MYIPTRYLHSTEVEKAVDAFIQTLGPEVVRVRYNIGEDWTGDPALYFRIVLSDESAVDAKTFNATAERIRDSFFDQLQALERWGLFPHVSFRSNAEQASLNDPKWA